EIGKDNEEPLCRRLDWVHKPQAEAEPIAIQRAVGHDSEAGVTRWFFTIGEQQLSLPSSSRMLTALRFCLAPATGKSGFVEAIENPTDGRQGAFIRLKRPFRSSRSKGKDRSGARDLFEFNFLANHKQFSAGIKPQPQMAVRRLSLDGTNFRNIRSFLL